MTLEAVLAHISRQNLNYLYEKKKKGKKKKKIQHLLSNTQDSFIATNKRNSFTLQLSFSFGTRRKENEEQNQEEDGGWLVEES